jgi:hypothetical protein
MELEDSLSCSQEPATGTYPEPDESTRKNLSCFSNLYSNTIILPFMHRPSVWPLPFGFSDKNFIYILWFRIFQYSRI